MTDLGNDVNKLNQQFNSDDILIRSVIGGLLNILNNKINYSQVWDTSIQETVTVPWIYSYTSSNTNERFIQDNYTMFGQSCLPKLVDGNFDMYPRGIISYSGSRIESESITSRFVQGSYLKQEDGKLQSYVSFLYSIPLEVDFSCTIFCDNFTTALKIEQSIREEFYKNKSFYVLFRGMRIGCNAGFPEEVSGVNSADIVYDFNTSDKGIKMTFNIAVETYQPIFDPTTAIKRENDIKSFGYDVILKDAPTDKELYIITPNTKDASGNDIIYPSGSPLQIVWDWKSSNSDMCSIEIGYVNNDTSIYTKIDVVENHGFYIWNIPDNFSNYNQPIISIINTDTVNVQSEPVVKIIPNNNSQIDVDSFVIISPGFFFTDGTDTSVQFTIEYTSTDGSLVLASNYYFNLINGKVNIDNPVSIVGEPLNYTLSHTPMDINLKIKDISSTPKEDELSNLLIL